MIRGGNKGGGKKRERERDSEKDGGPLAADAEEGILWSIHCVMAASSWSSQSQHSCHQRVHPLQVVGRGGDQQRELSNEERHEAF